MPLRWTPDLAVGHARIDAQHQELIRRFNTLLEACRCGQGKCRVAELLEFLDTYVVDHFAAEELLMLRYLYPDREEHLAQHRYFRAKLKDLKQSLHNEGARASVVVSTNKALLDWILRHIKQVDVHLGAYLRVQT